MSDTSPDLPTDDDIRDPAHPVGDQGPSAEEPDQDSEPTMNAPDSERPDGLATEDDASTGGDGSPS